MGEGRRRRADLSIHRHTVGDAIVDDIKETANQVRQGIDSFKHPNLDSLRHSIGHWKYKEMRTMKKLMFTGFAFGALLSLAAAQAQTAGQDMKDAGHDTAHATKTVTHKTVHGTKVAAHDTAHGTKVAAHDTEQGTKVAARDTAHGTKVGADKTEDATRTGYHKTVHGTKKVVHKVDGDSSTPRQ
jgi:hypothetical protein